VNMLTRCPQYRLLKHIDASSIVASTTDICQATNLNNDRIEVIVTPQNDSLWIRGEEAFIEWHDDRIDAEYIRVELRRHGSLATTVISTKAYNTGSLVYKKVPWGMMTGDGYYVVIIASEKQFVSPLFRIGTSSQRMYIS
jgi:hypothetical protein